jgi:hypothetical protein
VRARNANSHAGQGWETFTAEVLRAVAKSSKGIVFLAWGSPAQKRVDSIGVNKTKHCILRSVHPSPLSATKGFFECKHFIKANEWLRNRYGVEGEVEWDCLADGKQGDSSAPKPPAQNIKEDKPDIGRNVSAMIPAGGASYDGDAKESRDTGDHYGKNEVTDEDAEAYEFDESYLAGIP